MMIKIKNFLADNWAMFFFVALGAAFIFALGAALDNSRNINALCYSHGMVVVNTDAGQYCSDPRAMLRIKQ